MNAIITHEILKSWRPCSEGFVGFCRLFPEGATLMAATEGLIADGHSDWAYWLFENARNSDEFKEDTAEGFQNTGDQNTGDQNTGHRNTGDQNTGHWNTGHRNTGFFNTVTPDDVLAFNKPCKRSDWDGADIPSFLYFNTTEWVHEDRMTDAEKAENPNFSVAQGYLKVIPYQQAFQEAWRKASESDRKRVIALPNFDAAVFKEISGIDVGEAA